MRCLEHTIYEKGSVAAVNARSIQEIDKNFVPSSCIPNDVEYFDVLQPPFVIDGLYDPSITGKFCRLPQQLLPLTNEGVQNLAWNTSGGRLRFCTDSPYLALVVQLNGVVHMMHMPRTGNSGFDLYTGSRGTHAPDQRFVRNFAPTEPVKESGVCYNSCHFFDDAGETISREVTLYFPLYNGVQKLLVGLKKGSSVWAPASYRVELPVLFYGSSITQGGCASRPGNNYICHLSRWLDCNFICLGFSGSAKGEESIARHISSLDLSAFVLDYDHNAPDIDHLERTHFRFYQIIRQAKPNLPILMISKPDFDRSEENVRRRDIVLKSYLKARAAGDKNLWFVDGETLFQSQDRDACTVDGCHPNDLGFYRMARTIYPKLKMALGL